MHIIIDVHINNKYIKYDDILIKKGMEKIRR